jgi:hypothetical protein
VSNAVPTYDHQVGFPPVTNLRVVTRKKCQMRRIVIAAAMSLFVVSLAALASADTLVLRDGSRIEGTVLAIAGRTITFRHADGASRRYPTSRIDSLEFFSADRENPRAAKARRLETPAATALVVRTVATIDSRNSVPAER